MHNKILFTGYNCDELTCRAILLLLIIAGFSSWMPVNLYAQAEDHSVIRIIFRGDDMGISHSSNRAIIKAYKSGLQKSAEVIVPGPWFPEAVRMLNNNPGLDVGVHLVLTSEWEHLKWRPLTSSPSLTDSLGYFQPFIWPNQYYGENRALLSQDWKLDEVEQELRKQIETALSGIDNVTHLTNHMGLNHMHPDVNSLVKNLAAEYNLDINTEKYNFDSIRFGERLTTGEEKITRFIEILYDLEPGNYLLVTHPDLNTPETRSLFHIGYEDVARDRQGDTDLLTSKRVKDVIEELGIQVISYGDLPGLF